MMVQSKTKVTENDENGAGKAKRRSAMDVDHWAFLEEIEAPMWADLTLEQMLMAEDNDDAWFHTSHPFHQCSARQLRSAFSHSDVGNDFLNFNLHGGASPKLPSSVSKSRGKDYCKNWVRNGGISSNKRHPVNDLGNKISSLDKGSSQESNPKVSCVTQIVASGSITSSLCNNSYTTTLSDSSPSMVDDKDTRGVLNSQSASTSERISTSTITAESCQQQHSMVLEAPKEGLGHTNGLLNALKSNLRKSCATRPASRVEVCDDKEPKGRKSSCSKSSVGSSNLGCDIKSKAQAVVQKPDHQRQVRAKINVCGELKGRKSSSGKSSVGSSNVGCDRKGKAPALGKKPDHHRQVKAEINIRRELKVSKSSFGVFNEGSSNPRLQIKKKAAGAKQNNDRNPKVRNVVKLDRPVQRRVEAGEASLHSTKAYNSKKEGRDTSATSARQGAPMSKVLIPTIQQKSLNQPLIKSQGVKGNGGSSSRFNRVASTGKENLRGKVILNERRNVKENMPVAGVSDQKKPKLKLENTTGRIASIGSKVRTGRGNDGKSTSNARIFLR